MKKAYWILFFFSVCALFIVPFFWLAPGLSDLGGDGNRIYYLDPISFLNASLVNAQPLYAYIPFLWCLSILMKLTGPGTYLISSINGLKLSLSFIFMFLFLRKILSQDSDKKIKNGYKTIFYSSYFGSLVYISFITSFGWYQSLIIHFNIFLNPFLAYTLLSYLIEKKFRYIVAIVVSMIVLSVNYGFGAFPQLFSFCLLFIPFIFLYKIIFLRKSKFTWQMLGIFLLLLGSQIYHLLPTFSSILDTGGGIYQRAFSGPPGLPKSFFYDVNKSILGGLSRNIFAPIRDLSTYWMAVIIPIISIGGYLFKRGKIQILTGVFFVLSFYLISANITEAGVELYRRLQYIPGMSMFQYFNEKWYHVFAFFYVLTFSMSLKTIFERTKTVIFLFLSLLILVSVIPRNITFFRGDVIKAVLTGSKELTPVVKIDRNFFDIIDYVKRLPKEGKMLTLPLPFPYGQIISGENEHGVYAGTSLITMLGGKSDFTGFWTFGKLRKDIEKAILTKDDKKLYQLLSILNIRYVYHNSDSRIIDSFPAYPYYSKEEFPALRNQTDYKEFLSRFPMNVLFTKSFYTIYELHPSYVRKLISIPKKIYQSSEEFFESNLLDSAYIPQFNETVDINKEIPVTFINDSPMHYTFSFTPHGNGKMLLVFLEPYNPLWKIKFQNKNITVLKQLEVDGYANSWLIEVKNSSETEVVYGEIVALQQILFQYGIYISIGSLIGIVFFTILAYRNKTL